MTTIFYHPYLEHEDVISIVMSSFADKTVMHFIDSVRNNKLYKKHIVKDDIYSTYANFINNIDTTTILNDFIDSYDTQTIIDLVIADNDSQLESQDIEIDYNDESLIPMAIDNYKHIILAINNKSTAF